MRELLRSLLVIVFLVLWFGWLWATPAFGQPGIQADLPRYTVAQLPTPGSLHLAVLVVDASSPGNCTVGGGASYALCAWNGSSYEPAGGGGGGISASSIYSPDAGGGNATLNLVNCAPAVVTNRDRDGALTVNLCDARAGMEVWVIWENATQNVIVEPTSSDTIATPEVAGQGDGLTWTAVGTVGSVMHLLSLEDNEWRVMGFKGAAAVDNNSGP